MIAIAIALGAVLALALWRIADELRRHRREAAIRQLFATFAPPAAQPQTMSVVANGETVGAGPLLPEGSRVQVFVPEGRLVPGENRLCLRFSTALPAAEGERPAAAGVWVIQLP